MEPDAPAPLREPLLTFVAAIAVAAALFWVGHAVPIVGRNLHALIAVVFLYAPALAGRWGGRGFDYHDAGLRLDPVGRGAGVLGVVVALTFPLFIAAYFGFYGAMCVPAGDGQVSTMTALGASVARVLGPLCPGNWLGWTGAHARLPQDALLLTASQIVVVALPEELFFRGYLLGRLEQRWPPARRLLGAPVGMALVASAVLFALGHFLVDFNPQRLAVFFPGLVFAWMRVRTGSIWPGAAYHALCNLLSDTLHTSSFS